MRLNRSGAARCWRRGQLPARACDANGRNPDDLLRPMGSRGWQKLLDNAMPMVRCVAALRTMPRFDSPERKAAWTRRARKIMNITRPRSAATMARESRNLRWQAGFTPPKGLRRL